MDYNNQSVIMTRCETVSYVLKYQQTSLISTNPTYDDHSPTLTFVRLSQTNSGTTLGFYFLFTFH